MHRRVSPGAGPPRQPRRRRARSGRSPAGPRFPPRFQRQRAVDEVGGIAPLVVGLDRQPERLADAHERRQHRVPAHARPRHDRDPRALRQGDVVVGGDRVGEDAELEFALAIGLHADAGRAEAAVAEADGDGVAGAQEILGDADIERAAPGADVALELPLGFQGRAVGGLNGRVALPLGVRELHRAEVGGEAEPDLDGAGVVDAEGPGRIDEGQALQRARLEGPRRGEHGRAHQVGPVVRIGHRNLMPKEKRPGGTSSGLPARSSGRLRVSGSDRGSYISSALEESTQ